MANRVSVYGRAGEAQTERIRRELRSMSLTYDFYDISRTPDVAEKIFAEGATEPEFPKVRIEAAGDDAALFLSRPDADTLRQVLYAQDVLGVTSYWV